MPLTVEYTGLRVINVENFAAPANSGVDVRKVDLALGRHSPNGRSQQDP